MTDSMRPAAPAAAGRSSDLYRAVWRWHFYAGLFTLPFMILLAVTGALYLFRDEIDGLVHRDLKAVAPRAAPPLGATALVDAALAAHPGTALKYLPPPSATASAEVGVRTSDGVKLSVHVDPYDGHVLGAIPDQGTVMWTVRTLHSLAFFGPVANALVEIVGGWAIVLVGTGFYLWWPRRRQGGGLSVRGRPRQRIFWRDLHAVGGAVAGLFIAFLALTGMPWSVFWGDQVNRMVNGTASGYPSGVRVDVPLSADHMGHAAGPTAWSLENAAMPESAASGAAPIGLDAAVAIFDRLGLAEGYAVNLPSGPTGVYTGSVYPDDLSRQRVVHLDQYTGAPLVDVAFADYGPLAKSIEWGINVHMGQEFGLANQLLMLLVCVAVVLMSVSAAVMWWKRRPSRSLGVPPPPADPRALRGVLVILAAAGLLFPLVGASLLVMLGLDRLFAWRPRLA